MMLLIEDVAVWLTVNWSEVGKRYVEMTIQSIL